MYDHLVSVFGDKPIALDQHCRLAAVRRSGPVTAAVVGRPFLGGGSSEFTPRVLYDYRAEHFAHAPQRRADRLVSRLLRPRLYLANLGHGLDDRVPFAREEVLSQRVQNIHAVDQIALAYRYVH